jgi:hypothetical protein
MRLMLRASRGRTQVAFGTLFALIILIFGRGAAGQSTPSYTTSFPLTENPISEAGAWHHLDPTLSVVKTEPIGGVHIAHGTQTGAGNFDDANAYLSGFPLNQTIQGTVWKASPIPDGGNHEIELLLRWSDDNPVRQTAYGPTQADGYEVNVHQDGNYIQLGRFKGANFYSQALGVVPQTGHIFKATITTNSNGSVHIVVTWNGVVKIDYTDPAANRPPTKGNPGIGFYIGQGATRNDVFGFSSITATSLGGAGTQAPSAPTNFRIVP